MTSPCFPGSGALGYQLAQEKGKCSACAWAMDTGRPLGRGERPLRRRQVADKGQKKETE